MALFPTTLQTRQLVSFYDPANPQTFFQPRLNPIKITRKPTTVRKYQKSINGTSVIQGQWEYPPQEISLTWNQLDYADYQQLRAFTFTYPIIFIDNNDNGFLGAFCIESAEQIAGLSKNVWSVTASILVEAPYNGNQTFIPQLNTPAITLSLLGSGGFIPTGLTTYLWATVTTPWGESIVGNQITVTTAANNSSYSLNWTNPTSNWYRTVRLYWNVSPVSSNATLVMETEPGQTGSFSIFGPYLNYTAQTPPTYGRAFTGYWAGALWVPST